MSANHLRPLPPVEAPTYTTHVCVHEGTHVLITTWSDGTATVATKAQVSHSWGPPTTLELRP